MSPAEKLAMARQIQTLLDALMAAVLSDPEDDEYVREKLTKASRAMDYASRHWARVAKEGGENG